MTLSITISDDQDSFTMQGKTVTWLLSDYQQTFETKSALASYVSIAEQMFIDHEQSFSDEDAVRTEKVRVLFEEMRLLLA